MPSWQMPSVSDVHAVFTRLITAMSPGSEDGMHTPPLVRPTLPVLLLPLVLAWAGLRLAEHVCWSIGNDVTQVTTHAIVSIIVSIDVRIALITVIFFAVTVFLLRLRMWNRFGSKNTEGVKRKSDTKRFFGFRHLGGIGFLALAGFSLGLISGVLFWHDFETHAGQMERIAGNRCLVEVTDDPNEGLYGTSSMGRMRLPGGDWIKVRIAWPQETEPLSMGQWFYAAGSYNSASDEMRWMHEDAVAGSFTPHEIENVQWGATLRGVVGAFRQRNIQMLSSVEGQGSTLLRGVLLGDCSALENTDLYDDFRITGLAHLIAVSGSHLAVIASLASWLLTRLQRARWTTFGILALLLVGYVVLTGLQPSAIRACMMTLVAQGACFIHRRRHGASALAFTALLMLLFYPPNAYSVGFSLSVCAVFGLVLFLPLVRAWGVAAVGCDLSPGSVVGHSIGKRVLLAIRSLVSPLAMTLTAEVATLPVAAPLFAMVSIVGPVANLLVTPFVTVLVGGGIIVILIVSVIGQPAMILIEGLCAVSNLTGSLVGLLTSIPHAALPFTAHPVLASVSAGILALLIWIIWPQPKRARARILTFVTSAALLVAVTVPGGCVPQDAEVIMLDIGQGDAFVVRDGSNLILIDTGEQGTSLLKALARHHITRLDAVVITHGDTDHCGALNALKGTVEVDRVLFAEGTLGACAGDEMITQATRLVGETAVGELSLSDTITVGDSLVLEAVWPESSIEEGGNEESLCLRLDYDENADGTIECRVLFTGDAEKDELQSMIENDSVDAIDILKVGHHGSSDALTLEQAELLHLRAALISVGADNRYGHPTKGILDLLDASGVRTYRTDQNGDVTITFDRASFSIACATIVSD